MRFHCLVVGAYIFICALNYARCSTSKTRRPDESIRQKISHHRHPKLKASTTNNEFDIERNEAENLSSNPDSLKATISENGEIHEYGRPGRIDHVGERITTQRKGKRHRNKIDGQREQERGWHYCSDGRKPKNLRQIKNATDTPAAGYMCRDMYPTSTCCYDHDLNMELVGDKILEQVPEIQCAKMLMKLRCAHCSPRSWWLFHAPDMNRLPHKRVLPIMCPSFCRKFHRLCRDSVAGLEGDDFCDYHTTTEEGPCFPDSVVRRGSID